MSNAKLKLSTERLKAQLDKLEDKFETELGKWRKKLKSVNLKRTRRHLTKTRGRRKTPVRK